MKFKIKIPNPIKQVNKAVEAVQKGAEHVVKEAKDEIINKPIESAQQGIEHVQKEVIQETQNTVKEAAKDIILDENAKLEKKLDDLINDLKAGSIFKRALGVFLGYLKVWILKKITK